MTLKQHLIFTWFISTSFIALYNNVDIGTQAVLVGSLGYLHFYVPRYIEILKWGPLNALVKTIGILWLVEHQLLFLLSAVVSAGPP